MGGKETLFRNNVFGVKGQQIKFNLFTDSLNILDYFISNENLLVVSNLLYLCS